MAGNSLIPNSTQIPNVLTDLLEPFLKDGEVRVLRYICRRTYGFQKESDRIGLTQFVEGLRGESRQLDFGAGVSRQGAITALAVLKAIGIVEQLEGGPGRGNIPVYRLNLKCEMVKDLDLIAQEPETAREKIVKKLDLFRKKGQKSRPFTKKLSHDALSEEKVKDFDRLEKVKNAEIKGQNFGPTKERSTKQSLKKKITPVSPNGETSSSRGTRIPDDWQPTPRDLDWAKEKGYDTLLDLPLETEEFITYWRSQGSRATKLDWSGTWKVRMIEIAKRAKQHGARASPYTPPNKAELRTQQNLAAAQASIEEFERRHAIGTQ